MDKFSRLSVNMCLPCINVVLRNIRSVHLAEKRCRFSNKTIINHNNSVIQHHQGLPCRRQLPTCGFTSSQYVVVVPSSVIDGRSREALLLGLLTTRPQSSQQTSAFSSAGCQSFRGLCLQNSQNTRRAGISAVYHRLCVETDELLLGVSSYPRQSARLYSTTTPESKPPPRKSKLDLGKSPISWKNLLVVAGIGCAIVFGVQYLKREKDIERNKARSRLIGKAKLGGDWTLTDHHGNRRSSTDFRGQWLLIYFGFTHCPDVCPDEIAKIVDVINKADGNKELPKIQPIVITVDPERDTPEALKEYCSEFSPRLLGFTGSSEEIQKATHAYRVYFSAGPKDDDSDYIVDHSIISYLISPEGQFVDYYGQNKTVSEIYTSIQVHIGSYLKRKKSEPEKST